jgi:methylmalonyl-CoA epimerase
VKAVLDHVGIAVGDIREALAFYRDGLGLEVEGVEDVASQRVRAHFIPVGQASLELLEATAPDSPIAKYSGTRGPGLHHITLRVEDIAAALAQLKARGVRLIDETPRPGAEDAMVAFIHPSSAHGVLVELKQAQGSGHRAQGSGHRAQGSGLRAQGMVADSEHDAQHQTVGAQAISRHSVGSLELVSLYDGFFRLDGGLMFGMVPRPLWGKKVQPDDRNRITLAMRPLLVRGVRTMLIDAGLGDKEGGKFREIYGVDRSRSLDTALLEAGVRPEDIDIVLATHLHFDHAGGFTVRDEAGKLRPRFPRARYIVRRGEWETATHPNERNRASYLADDFLPLVEAGVLELVDDDQTIMPGVRVQRTGGHTAHHQMVWIESNGQHAAYPADIMPTSAHLQPSWIMGIDSYPMETLDAKKQFLAAAAARRALVFFEHDKDVASGRIIEQNGKWTIQR